MSAGRPRKPTNLQLLHGDRPDRVNRDEPVPGDVEVVPPVWLDGIGLEVWEQLAPDLIAQRVLTPWDAEAFALACDQIRLYREARADVEEDGRMIVGAMGSQIKHPMIQVMRDCLTSFGQIAGRFGLTPSDRAKLSIGGADEPKGAERLLS